MKKLFVLMLAAICFAFVGCGKKSKALVVATEATFPPYEFMIGQKFYGIDIDICQAVADKLGVPLQVENTQFDTIIANVVSGKAQVGASGITVTEERKDQVLFSIPYFKASQVIVVMNNSKILTPAMLKGVRIGCQSGTTGYDYVSNNLVKDKNSQLLQGYANAALAVEALKTGKLDAVVIDEGPALAFEKQNKGVIKVLPVPLTQEEYAIALNKKDTELCAVFNEVIKDLIDSGKMAEITEKNKKLSDSLGE